MSDTMPSRRRSMSASRLDGKFASAPSLNGPQTFSIFILDRDRTPVLSVAENNVNFVVRRHEDNPSAFKLPVKPATTRNAELPADQYYPHDKAAILAERQRIRSLLSNPNDLLAQKRSLVFIPPSSGMGDDASSLAGSSIDAHASASAADSMEVSVETTTGAVSQDGATTGTQDNAAHTLDTLSSDPSLSSQSSQESSQPTPAPVAPHIVSLDHINIPLPAPGLELYRPSASQTSLLLAPNEYHNIKANRVANGGPARARTRTRDEETCVCTEGDCLTSSCLNFLSHCECGPNCPRGEACGNRRLTRRQWSDVKVVQMGSKGYGAVANAPIAAGALVIEYVGEVIDQHECTRRTIMDKLIGNLNFYRIEVSCGRVIDPVPYGNKARFLNHSCSPNCASEKWHVNGELRVGLFALRDIAKGEELTWNYSYECVRGAELIKCLCGSDRCSGYLGLKPKPEARGDAVGDARGTKRQKTSPASSEARDAAAAAVVATSKTKRTSTSKTEAGEESKGESKRKSQSKKLDTVPASSTTPMSPATSRRRALAATGASVVPATPAQTPLRGRPRAAAHATTVSPVVTPAEAPARTRRSSRIPRGGENEEAASTPLASPSRTRKRGVRRQLDADSALDLSADIGMGDDSTANDGDEGEGTGIDVNGPKSGDSVTSKDGAMRDGAAVDVEEKEGEQKVHVEEKDGKVKRMTRTSFRTPSRAVARVGARSKVTRSSLSAAALSASPSPSSATPTSPTKTLAASPKTTPLFSVEVLLSTSALTLRSRRTSKAGRLSGGYDGAVDHDATTEDDVDNGVGDGRHSTAARVNTSSRPGVGFGTDGGGAVWLSVGGCDEYMHDDDDTEEEKEMKLIERKDENEQKVEKVAISLAVSPKGGKKYGRMLKAAITTATGANTAIKAPPDTTVDIVNIRATLEAATGATEKGPGPASVMTSTANPTGACVEADT